jgi:hypothetical protein
MTERKTQAGARRNSPPIKVYCLPDERSLIEENARAAGLSTGAFLRAIGQGYRVSGIVDNERVAELTQINGDLGRLGGLLKMWLTDDARMKPFGEDHIRALLTKIDSLRGEMRSAVKEVIKKRSSDVLAAKTPDRGGDDD